MVKVNRLLCHQFTVSKNQEMVLLHAKMHSLTAMDAEEPFKVESKAMSGYLAPMLNGLIGWSRDLA